MTSATNSPTTVGAMPLTQSVRWDLTYNIHLGATWSRFMNGLRDQVILANRCPSCERTFVPPQAYCEACYVRTNDWTELPPEGYLEVFTVVWQGFTGGPKPPYVVGGIRLDGADTLLMHVVTGLQLDDPSRARDQLPGGGRVRAVWSDERVGHILDISHFEPAA